MAVDATADTFAHLIAEGVVLVDVWGPRCEPCLALMPAVEALAEQNDGAWRLVKLDATQNREVCRAHRIMGLPTYLVFVDGVERRRLDGADTTIADIRTALHAEIERGGGTWT